MVEWEELVGACLSCARSRQGGEHDGERKEAACLLVLCVWDRMNREGGRRHLGVGKRNEGKNWRKRKEGLDIYGRELGLDFTWTFRFGSRMLD